MDALAHLHDASSVFTVEVGDHFLQELIKCHAKCIHVKRSQFSEVGSVTMEAV